MPRVFVAGLLNLETTLSVDAFPLEYAVSRYRFFGVDSTVSGVGYNVARGLQGLGSEVRLASLVGRDLAGDVVRLTLERDGLPVQDVLSGLDGTPQSVILYDGDGRRAVNTDLKDIQERAYPASRLEAELTNCDAAVICNINFARPALRIARARGIPIVTDLHAITDLENPYDQEFLESASVLFFSGERLHQPLETAFEVLQRFETRLVVVGMGAGGALLCERDREAVLVPARSPRAVVSTVGAGDALLSSFTHFLVTLGDPRAALQRAVLFAGWKVGAAGGASGLLNAAELEVLWDAG
ncbi:MAG: carbohydrate kinase family protein [Pleurocapsa sp. SU_196_0]|nr:carbohydrate kinase family protein [Pleurocapsa sp. SU_196_0]